MPVFLWRRCFGLVLSDNLVNALFRVLGIFDQALPPTYDCF